MNRYKLWLVLITILVLLGSLNTIAQAAVNLLYFQATTGNQYVQLVWETGSELNNAGFFVQRSSEENQGYIRIHDDLIPAAGDPLTGASYQYLDAGLVNGTIYWYRLESIDFSQASEFTTPVLVMVGGTPTPTPTGGFIINPTSTLPISTTVPPMATAIPTFTQAPTLTSSFFSSPTPDPTLTSVPGIAPGPLYPGPEQPSQATLESGLTPIPGQDALQAGVPTPVGMAGEISTFAPFPTVTIMFPATNNEKPLPDVQKLLDFKSFSWSNIVQMWPLGIIILAWIGLAIWFYFSNRQFG